MKVLRFGYMEEVLCNGHDLILNPLFNFESMKGLEHWGDVRMQVQVYFEYVEGA